MKQPVDRMVVDRVKELARPVLSSMGLELVDVEQTGGRGRTLLRIYIDKTEGVSLKDCEKASIYLGHALDVEDPIPFPYVLEVSSPGLNRPFKQFQDYQRALGKLIHIKLSQPLEGQWVLVGRLTTVEEKDITIKTKDRQCCKISLDAVQQARLEVEW